ncbi:MAG: SpoIIE family protein phosphatase [Planctomycetota bacterium]
MNDAVRFRTLAVLLIVFLTMVANALRIALSPDQDFAELPLAVPATIVVLMLYEAATLLWLSKLRDNSRPLPAGWIYANAALESATPTIMSIFIALSGIVSLEAAAAGPATHLYAIFIVLSVLHVRLLVSLTAGFVSAAGLAGLAITAILAHTPGTEQMLTPSLKVFSAVLVLCTGGAAGLVALRMRRYLETAATEAEARVRAEQDLQAAALIQQSLMPSEPPAIPGFEVVGWNRPADETGGDYFDWVALEDGRFAVCIADVTGHGLGPAMITCFCRAYARTALRVESRIATALQRLNAELVNDLGDGRFVTFAAVVITPDDDRILSTSAGHGPLILFRQASASVQSFGADALPLGVHDSSEEIGAVPHVMEPGDLFILLTDGFFEWANPSGQQFGTKRLEASLARHGHKPADQVISDLLADVEAFASGTSQPDDLTAVVIRRVSTNSSTPHES